MSYIDREKLIKRIEVTPLLIDDEFKRKGIIDLIKNAIPTADVAEVKHSRWIEQKPNPEVMKEFHNLKIGRAMSEMSIYWTCSECGLWGTPSQKYCPHCGAKMDVKGR